MILEHFRADIPSILLFQLVGPATFTDPETCQKLDDTRATRLFCPPNQSI